MELGRGSQACLPSRIDPSAVRHRAQVTVALVSDSVRYGMHQCVRAGQPLFGTPVANRPQDLVTCQSNEFRMECRVRHDAQRQRLRKERSDVLQRLAQCSLRQRDAGASGHRGMDQPYVQSLSGLDGGGHRLRGLCMKAQ